MLKRVYGSVDHFPGQDSPYVPYASPEPVAHLSQHKLLPILLERAEASPRTASIWFGTQVTAIRDRGSEVAVTVEHASARSERHKRTIVCSHLVAADGANSRVRDWLELPMEGDACLQNLINIHFFSKDLAQQLSKRPAMLYFCFNRATVAVIVAHSLADGEFVAQVPFFPPLQDLGDFSKTAAADIVRAAAGSDVEVEVCSVRRWAMSAQVASRFHKGRVFLAGDAAHRFPPAGGFGMNTGIQDAHNLAWKLAAVHTGAASEELLETYGGERRPVAEANTLLSVSNYEDALRVPRALGLDPRAANLASAVISPLRSVVPRGVASSALEAVLSLGRAAADASIPLLGDLKEKALERLFAEDQTLRLQFPAEDLGFSYRLDRSMASSKEAGAKPGRHLRGGYVPSTEPGARLPHCELQPIGAGVPVVASRPEWIFANAIREAAQEADAGGQNLEPSGGGATLSTIDVVAACGLRPLLIIGPGHMAQRWASLALSIHRLGYPVQVLQILDRPGGAASGELPSHTAVARAVDVSSTWAASRGVSENGAVLVRPDGHVAWRWNALGPAEGADLPRRLAAMFGRVAHMQPGAP
mmetsp:Transcript_35257/g.83598  ORF Transcript_35257/g.83598 Transcript_35257/m.83598 type:complete len:588 (+) Transcript_35257:1131-2894(+)